VTSFQLSLARLRFLLNSKLHAGRVHHRAPLFPAICRSVREYPPSARPRPRGRVAGALIATRSRNRCFEIALDNPAPSPKPRILKFLWRDKKLPHVCRPSKTSPITESWSPSNFYKKRGAAPLGCAKRLHAAARCQWWLSFLCRKLTVVGPWRELRRSPASVPENLPQELSANGVESSECKPFPTRKSRRSRQFVCVGNYFAGPK